MPRPPSSRPHDAEAGHEPPSHASGLAPSALIHALDDLQPDPLNANRGTDRGRAIDPAAVERMFDATRGAHISPGELEHIWRGQPGPPAERAGPDPAGARYCIGIDWAQKRDDTVAAVVRCETTPLQLVAVYRAQRRPWLSMTEKVGALLDEYPGTAAHDATGAGNAIGSRRSPPTTSSMGSRWSGVSGPTSSGTTLEPSNGTRSSVLGSTRAIPSTC